MPRSWDQPLENRGGKGQHATYPPVGITTAQQHDPELCAGSPYTDRDHDVRCSACGKTWAEPRQWEERNERADYSLSKMGPRQNGKQNRGALGQARRVNAEGRRHMAEARRRVVAAQSEEERAQHGASISEGNLRARARRDREGQSGANRL